MRHRSLGVALMTGRRERGKRARNDPTARVTDAVTPVFVLRRVGP